MYAENAYTQHSEKSNTRIELHITGYNLDSIHSILERYFIMLKRVLGALVSSRLMMC